MKRSEGRGVRFALHTPTAVRIMGSRPPAGQEPDPRALLRLDRRTKIRVVVATVIVLSLLGTVLALGVSKGIIGPVETGSAVTSQELTTRGFLELSIGAEGWDEELSTPPIVRLRDLSTGAVRYHAVRANVHETLELEAGDYEVSCISPVNADGSMYRMLPPEQTEVVATHTTNKLMKFESLPAAEATREGYLAVMDEVRIAVEQGDDSLQGDAGVQILDRLKRNVEASPTYAEPPADPNPVPAQEAGSSLSTWVPGAYSPEPAWSAPVVSAQEIAVDGVAVDEAQNGTADAEGSGAVADPNGEGAAGEGDAADGSDAGESGGDSADGGGSGQDSGTGDSDVSEGGEAASADSPSDTSNPAAAEGTR